MSAPQSRRQPPHDLASIPGVLIRSLEQPSGRFRLKSCVSSELPGHFYVSEGLEDLAGGFVSHCGDVVRRIVSPIQLQTEGTLP